MPELQDLLRRIGEKYSVEIAPLKLGDRELKVLQFTDLESYIEKLIATEPVGAMDLPYWAKIWESDFLLALFIGNQPVVPWRRMLEIGAGMGIVGLYGSLCGHNVTIADTDDEALMFARANVLLNDSKAEVRRLRLDTAEIGERYEVIFGSEVIYDRATYPLLVSFLRRALAPNGTIFLSKGTSLHAPRFFEELTKYFKFKRSVRKVRSEGEAVEVSLYAIRFKDAPEE
ncbi:MAG: protein N-lysine methyltransferase family protein [Desulfobacteraceae bacterium]|nr:protein N-lysine methyltransferase family protein [Desulfobacteraceae bacterium]